MRTTVRKITTKIIRIKLHFKTSDKKNTFLDNFTINLVLLKIMSTDHLSDGINLENNTAETFPNNQGILEMDYLNKIAEGVL